MAEQLESTGARPHSVSYSEVSSYLLCNRKWEYGYGRSLRRVTESFSLMLGSAVHTVLEAFYTSILSEGYDRELQGTEAAWGRAYNAATVAYDELFANGFEDSDRKATLKEIVFDFYLNRDLDIEPFVLKGWLIEAVEYEVVLDTFNDDTGETIRTPGKIDLIVLDPDGKRAVVDHKCLDQFYTDDAAALQPQIPLYIALLRGKNFKVDYGYYNMLRNSKIVGEKMLKAELIDAIVSKKPDADTKATMAVLEPLAESLGIKVTKGATPEQRWAHLILKPNGKRVSRSFVEQLVVASELIELSQMTEDERDLRMHRVANKMVCQSCSFKDLCTMELVGGNVPLLIRTEYAVRDRQVFDTESEEGDVA